MIDERVDPGGGRVVKNEAALRWCEIQGLSATRPTGITGSIGRELVRALRVDGVELAAHHVEAQPLGRAGREHPDPYALSRAGRERVVHVLGGMAVEHRERGLLRGDLLRIHNRVDPLRETGLIRGRGREVRLALHEQVLTVHARQVRGIDDHRAEHARCDMTAHGHGGAVVEPDPGTEGREPIHERFAGGDRAHGLVGGDVPRVEVHGVTHGAAVGQGDLEGVTHLPAQRGPHVLTVVGPHVLGHAGGHLAGHFLDVQRHPVHGFVRCGGQLGGAGRETLTGDGVEIRRLRRVRSGVLRVPV